MGQAFSNGCRYPGDPQARGSEIYNCRCTLAAAIDGVDTGDGERRSKLPPGMTYQQWKDELAPKGGDGARGSAAVGEVVKSEVAAVAGRAKRAVNAYIEAQRVFGLTAPGFSPRPRKTVQLPKAEYAVVVSAINSNYHARFEGKRKGRIAVGNYQYVFEISDFDEYRITGRKAIE